MNPELRTRSQRRARRRASARASLVEPEKCFYVVPDAREARDQLMVIIEQRERGVRPRLHKRLDRPIIDRLVSQSLKDERRLLDRGIERVVPQAVFVERDIQIVLSVV